MARAFLSIKNRAAASLLFKEWVKLRLFFWIPLVLVGLALADYGVSLRTVMSVHGEAATWFGFLSRPSVIFDKIEWALIASGVILALAQSVPECIRGRLRLSLHLPIDHWKALAAWAGTGLGYLALLILFTFCAMAAIHASLRFPLELSLPICRTILPWGLAAMVSWCAVAAAVAEPSWARRALLLATGGAWVLMLSTAFGFDGMRGDVWLYALAALPWVFVFYACAMRIKGDSASRVNAPRLACAAVALVVFSWLLPFNAARVMRPERSVSDAYWSDTAKDFVATLSDAKGIHFRLAGGGALAPKEGKAMLPFLYRNDLNKWDMFPVVIDGVPYSFDDTRDSQVSRVRPRLVNLEMPSVSGILESEPEGASFALPGSVLLIKKDGLALHEIKTGKRDGKGEKSLFAALASVNASFPLQAFAASADPLKPYDEGAWLVDREGKLIQLKKVRGAYRARVAEDKIPGRALYLSSEEKSGSDYYGVLVTTEGVFLNTMAGGLEKLAVESLGYRPQKDSLKIYSTPVSRTVTLQSYEADSPFRVKAVALDRVTGDALGEFEEKTTEKDFAFRAKREALRSAASLFALTQMSAEVPRVQFDLRLARCPWISVLSGMILAFIYLLAVLRWKRRLPLTPARMAGEVKSHWLEYALVALFSVPGLIGACLAGDILQQRAKKKKGAVS